MTNETVINVENFETISLSDMAMLAGDLNAIEPSAAALQTSIFGVESIDILNILWPITIGAAVLAAGLIILPALCEALRRLNPAARLSKDILSN